MNNSGKEEMKILVADDEELIRWSLRRAFEAAGYTVDMAANGKEAIQKVEENNYDIVVTDLEMPELNGMKMLMRMREMGISLPVIVISAYLSENVIKESLHKGAFRCLDKPFQMEDVLNVVKEAVEYKAKG